MNNFYLGFINRKGTSGGGSASKTIQGTKSSPLLVTNSSIIVLDPSNDEDIYVQGNGGAVTLTSANFSGVKSDSKNLRIIGTSDVNTVTISPGGSLILNGNRILSNNSIIELRSDSTNLTESGGNAI